MQTVTVVTIFESKKTGPFPTLPFLYLIVNSNLLFQPSPDSRNADHERGQPLTFDKRFLMRSVVCRRPASASILFSNRIAIWEIAE